MKKKSIRKTRNPSNSSLKYKKMIYAKKDLTLIDIAKVISLARLETENTAIANHIFKDLLKSKSFSENLISLITTKSKNISSAGPVTLEKSTLDDNLNLIAIILENYKDQLKDFLLFRRNIEVALLQGRFKDVEDLLNKLEFKLGRSLWSISTRYSNFYFQEEDELLLSYHNDLIGGLNKLDSTYIYYELARSKKAQTFEGFKQSLERQLEDLSYHGYEDMVDAIKFISDFDPTKKHPDLKYITANVTFLKLPDIYNNFLRILKIAYLKNEKIDKTLNTLSSLTEFLNDNELKIFINKNRNNFCDEIESESMIKKVLNAYISEDYIKVIQNANKCFQLYPTASHLYEVVAKSMDRNEDTIEYPYLVREIISYMNNIHKDKDFELNLKRLKLTFLNLKQFDWSYHLKAQVEKYSFKAQDKANLKYNFSDLSQIRIPPFDKSTLIELKKQNMMSDVNEFFKGNESLNELIMYTLGTEISNPNCPMWRLLKSKAELLSYQGFFEDALFIYSDLEEDKSRNSKRDDIIASLIFTLLKAGREHKAIVRLSQCLLEGREPSIFPLYECSKFIISNSRQTSDVVFLESASIILHFYNLKYPHEDVTQVLSNITEQLLFEVGIDDADKLRTENFMLNDFILTHILTVDVMDGFIRLFDSDLDVYSTKMSLMLNLIGKTEIKSDEKSFGYIVNEYNSTFNRMVLMICTSESNEGRIRVDKESLKVGLIEELSEDFEIFDKAILISDLKLNKFYYEADEITLTGSEKLSFFTNIVSRIFREYTLNKLHGLDNCLNLNFRHGEIRNHLWSPLRQHALTGKKISDTKFNVDSVFIDYKLINSELLESLKSKLSKLLTDIEYIIFQFRSRCNADAITLIQGDDRFFQFKYSKIHIEDFVREFFKAKPLDSLIDLVFKWLDAITDEILRDIRETHISTLRLQFEELFLRFEYDTKKAPNEFKQKIGLAKAGVSERIDEIQSWFDWAEEPKNPFNFGAAVEKALKLVESLYPNTRFNFDMNDRTNFMIKANLFTSLVAIFTLAIENSAKHSGIEKTIDLTIDIHSVDNSTYLVIENSICPSIRKIVDKKISVIRNELISDVTEKAAQDSGSGIFKIQSILVNKVKTESLIDVKRVQNTFTLKIKILKHEDLEHEISDS